MRRLDVNLINRRGPLARLAYLGAGLFLLALVSCGGRTDMGPGDFQQVKDKPGADRAVSARTDGLLPPPGALAKRIDASSPSLIYGSSFEDDLPNHRVEVRGNSAVYEPGTGKGKGYGLYAYAIYRLSAPAGTTDGDSVAIMCSINPLYEDNGKGGENPLYTGLANWNDNSWDWKAQDYNSSRSNTTSIIRPEEDHNSDNGYLLAIAVAPYSGGGGGGAILVNRLSVSSGWDLHLLDNGERSSSIPPGQQELDSARCEDGTHQLAYFAGESGLRHLRSDDALSRTADVPQTRGAGPNVSQACSPFGLPHIFSWNSRSNVGPVRWMAPEGMWHSGTFAEGDSTGAPFDPAVCPDAAIDSKGVAHVAFVNPDKDALMHAWSGPDGEWHEEVIAQGLRIRQRPDLLISEWDALVCVARGQSGGIYSVYSFQKGARDWKRSRLADIPPPVDATGSPRGFVSCDLNGDGRLDVLCNAPDGVHLIEYQLSSGDVSVSRVSSSSSVVCADLVSSGPRELIFLYDDTLNDVEVVTRLHKQGVIHRDIAARNVLVAPGLNETVHSLSAIVDPDDDGDGIFDVSCYLLVTHKSPTNPDVKHWTLEVRVNRIEMA